MKKKRCVERMNTQLRHAMLSYQARAGMTQEKLAEMLQITPRACSALEHAEYGFSIFTAVGLLSILPLSERLRLFMDLCEIMAHSVRETS